jgi:hydrogenase expression/formation protein HypC
MCLAIPGQIVELVPDSATGAIVSVVGVRRRIDLGLLQDDPPAPGDWVLIHVGFAMSKISEVDAREQMETLARLGEADAALDEVKGYGLGEHDEGQGSP